MSNNNKKTDWVVLYVECSYKEIPLFIVMSLNNDEDFQITTEYVQTCCRHALVTYRSDPETGHQMEDDIILEVLRHFAQAIANLPNTDEKVVQLQNEASQMMKYINKLVNADRTKWYA